jgi:hypothetical protein
VAALKTRNGRSVISQQIDDFSFALVTPLGADNNNILSHGLSVANCGR